MCISYLQLVLDSTEGLLGRGCSLLTLRHPCTISKTCPGELQVKRGKGQSFIMGDWDPCECIFNHNSAMNRLMEIVRLLLNGVACASNATECCGPPPLHASPNSMI